MRGVGRAVKHLDYIRYGNIHMQPYNGDQLRLYQNRISGSIENICCYGT